jgi:hypothetical protein
MDLERRAGHYSRRAVCQSAMATAAACGNRSEEVPAVFGPVCTADPRQMRRVRARHGGQATIAGRQTVRLSLRPVHWACAVDGRADNAVPRQARPGGATRYGRLAGTESIATASQRDPAPASDLGSGQTTDPLRAGGAIRAIGPATTAARAARPTLA